MAAVGGGSRLATGARIERTHRLEYTLYVRFGTSFVVRSIAEHVTETADEGDGDTVVSRYFCGPVPVDDATGPPDLVAQYDG